MTAPGRILLIFLDGVGIGEDDPDVNPFVRGRALVPTLLTVMGGSLPTLDAPHTSDGQGCAFPLDARLDMEGTPQMQETPPNDYGGFLGLTIGGTREQGSHKGYGFSLMVEVLGAMLSGSVPSMFDETPRESMFKNYFAAYNIEAFTDLDTFKDNMDQMLDTLKNTKPAPGHERVLYPGLTESEDERDRRANGIPLHKEVVQWFRDTCAEMEIPYILG